MNGLMYRQDLSTNAILVITIVYDTHPSDPPPWYYVIVVRLFVVSHSGILIRAWFLYVNLKSLIYQ